MPTAAKSTSGQDNDKENEPQVDVDADDIDDKESTSKSTMVQKNDDKGGGASTSGSVAMITRGRSTSTTPCVAAPGSGSTSRSRTGRACATAKDEPVVYYELSGRNEVPFVKMWGWTNNCPMECPNLKEDLCMKKVVYPDGSITTLPVALEELEQYSESIQQLGRAASSHDYVNINIPVVVQVVAKKIPGVVYMRPKDNNNMVVEDGPSTALLFGNIVVADGTGAAILTLPNESVNRVFDEVEVGDFLILKKATYRKSSEIEKKRFMYPFEEHLVGVEIKVEKYSVRHVQHVARNSQPKWKPKFPEFLFGDGEDSDQQQQQQIARLWTPKDFEPGAKTTPPTGVYLDIVGVVNYVGRVERYQLFRRRVLHVDSERDLKDTRNSKISEQRIFRAYRIVTLVDKENQMPLRLTLLVTKDCVAKQRSIVPGMTMIITNCQVKAHEENRSEMTVHPSVCSKLYLNEDIEKYFSLMPERFMKFATSQVLNFQSYHSILKRDFDWGAGGSFSVGISNPDSFYARYKELENNKARLIRKIPQDYVFGRRERLSVTIRGKIVLVQEVLETNCLAHLPKSADGKWKLTPNLYVYGTSQEYEEIKKSAPEHFCHPPPCLCERCSLRNWFHFARRINLDVPANITKTISLCKAVTDRMKELCGPLLMPASYPIAARPTGELPKLAEQPRLKSFDHFRISIRDEDNGHCYQAMWNTYSMQEMETRYKEALGKVIVADIAIFCSEPEIKKEVILRDFIIEPQPPASQCLELSHLADLALSTEEDSIFEISGVAPVQNIVPLQSETHTSPEERSNVNIAQITPITGQQNVNVNPEVNIGGIAPEAETESQVEFSPRFSSTQMNFNSEEFEENLIQPNSGSGSDIEMVEESIFEQDLPVSESTQAEDDLTPSDIVSSDGSGSDNDSVSHYFENSGVDIDVENINNAPISDDPPAATTSTKVSSINSRKRKFEEVENGGEDDKETGQGQGDDSNAPGIPVAKPRPSCTLM